jgi:hypothetical protein
MFTLSTKNTSRQIKVWDTNNETELGAGAGASHL